MNQFRRLAVLIAVNFVDMIGFMIVLPLLPFYALKLHATPETIGRLIASFSIAQLLAAPLWGRMSDRYGRRPVRFSRRLQFGAGHRFRRPERRDRKNPGSDHGR